MALTPRADRRFDQASLPEDVELGSPMGGDFGALSGEEEEEEEEEEEKEAVRPKQARAPLQPTWRLYSSCVLGFVLALQCGWSAAQLSSFNNYYEGEGSWSAELWTGGGIAGALLMAVVGESCGRKSALLLSCGPMVLGAAAQASAPSPLQFGVGRFLAGVASGGVTATLSCYVSELSPPRLRSALGVLVQGGIATGALLVTALHDIDGSKWRTAAAIPAAMGVLVVSLAPILMVESPVWLLLRGRRQDALAAFGQLYGERQAHSALHRARVQPVGDGGACGGARWRPLLARPFALAAALAVAHKLSGIDVVLDYALHDYQENDGALIATSAAVCVCAVAGVLARWVSNRRLLLAGLAASLVTAALIASREHKADDPDVSGLAALFVALFAGALGSFSWVLMADLSPDASRGATVAVAVSLLWLTSLLLSRFQTELYLDWSRYIEDSPLALPRVYTPLPIAAAATLVFVLFMVPNTTGKTSAEVQSQLNKPMRDLAARARAVAARICPGCVRPLAAVKAGDDSSDREETRTTRTTTQTTRTTQPTVLPPSSSSSASIWSDPELLRVQVRLKSIRDIRLIGTGGYGVVYLVEYRGSQLLASKRLRPGAATTQRTQEFIAEIKLVAKLEHPNIVRFVGAAWSIESDLQALFEYMENGDLRSFLSSDGPPRAWTVDKLQIAIDVAEALVYVHSFQPPLVHRDLKSRNVLLSADMTAKLTDFGVSRFQSRDATMTAGVGTSRWLAPEVISGAGDYGAAADVFSLGVVLAELDSHTLPYEDAVGANGQRLAEVAILQRVGTGLLRPMLNEASPPEVVELASLCLSFDPADRPSAPEVAYVLRTLKRKAAEP